MKTWKHSLAFIGLTLVLSGCTPIEESSEIEAPSTQEILDMAYLDELKAEATYAQVMEEFGEVKPFSNIIQAEVRHSQSIFNLYESFELEAPELDVDIPSFSSLQEACLAGVDAEIENIALYDELMEQIDDPSILSVFEKLQSASEEKHLPAFQRCSQD